MSRDDYANLSYEEHMSLIERTARVRLDVLIDEDVPDEMLLADSPGMDFQKLGADAVIPEDVLNYIRDFCSCDWLILISFS